MSKNLVLNIMMKAEDKSSAGFSKVQKAANVLSETLLKTQKELRGYEIAQRLIVQRNKLQFKMKADSQAIVQNREAYSKLIREIAKTGVATANQSAQLNKLANTHERLKTRQAKQGTELEKLNNRLKKYGITARTSSLAQEQLNQKHAAATKELTKQERALEKLNRAEKFKEKAGTAAVNFSATAIAARSGARTVFNGVGNVVGSAIEEEDAMMGVIRQVNGLKNADNSLNQLEIGKVRIDDYIYCFGIF